MDFRVILTLVGFLVWAGHKHLSAHIGPAPVYSGSLLALIGLLLATVILAVIAIVIRTMIRDLA